jgi:hypothetical protein
MSPDLSPPGTDNTLSACNDISLPGGPHIPTRSSTYPYPVVFLGSIGRKGRSYPGVWGDNTWLPSGLAALANALPQRGDPASNATTRPSVARSSWT